MSFTLYDASAPVFVAVLKNMRAWLDKAAAEKDPAALVEARLADDMKPLTAQYQFASDSAKNAVARLIGEAPPAMPDTETSFDELRARCDKTIAYIESVDPSAAARLRIGADDQRREHAHWLMRAERPDRLRLGAPARPA